MPVLQVGQVPFIALRPFFMVIRAALDIVRLDLHLTQ